MSSETAQARSVLAPFCVGLGIDLGYGGDAITPVTITFDRPIPHMYCPSFCGHRQHLQGDATNLPFICNGALDYVYSSHLIEDFTYDDLVPTIREWRRILAPTGVLVLNCPDQRRFLAHCEHTGQSINANHKEGDFSLRNFCDRVLQWTGDWEIIYENPDVKPYSWYLVARKV